MSEQEPDGPYVYQPFGMQHKEHWRADRVYAVSGLPYLARIEGLTKDEAVAVCAAIKAGGETVRTPRTCKESIDILQGGVGDSNRHYGVASCDRCSRLEVEINRLRTAAEPFIHRSARLVSQSTDGKAYMMIEVPVEDIFNLRKVLKGE